MESARLWEKCDAYGNVFDYIPKPAAPRNRKQTR